MSILSRACAGAFALCVLGVAGGVQGQGVALFPDDLPPSLAAVEDDLLPDGRDVCLRLGLDPQVPGRCHSFAVLVMSARQTDRSLWFSRSSSGSGPDPRCPDAVDFSRSKTGGLVVRLCRAPAEDVAITPGELAALTAEVSRLNALPRKTLAEHVKALALKASIGCVTQWKAEDCD